jgi:hypothetical protein
VKQTLKKTLLGYENSNNNEIIENVVKAVAIPCVSFDVWTGCDKDNASSFFCMLIFLSCTVERYCPFSVITVLSLFVSMHVYRQSHTTAPFSLSF